ncbi:MAG TPA: ATP-binding sensor histidine kinase [Myxococcaceae bacterium]
MLDIPGYRVVGTIRATGSNVLFHAVREADGLPAIIKTPMAPAPGPRESERYRREYGILQRLRDVSGVARPYAFERIRERPVLLLEKVQGETLSESLGKPLEVPRFLSLAISLASTLAEVHRRNVIHKDIKPSNIIVEPEGAARLIDFGAATLQKVEHLDGAPSHIEGTLAYISPEQTGRMNRSVDYRTDFYSLGVTFYELLTGRRPFHGRDVLEWFHAHMAQTPPPPRELNPGIPPALSAIVLKLLAKVAEERYQSAEGLKADLERCREQLSQREQEPFALGEHDTPGRFQLPQRLYGREAQVAALLQGFERVVRSGRPELVLVSGYSGIGKSSVVHELHKPVVQRRGFFLSAKFDQFQRDVPYATVTQALRGLVQQLLAGSAEEVERWRERVNQAWEGEGQVLVDLVPLLNLLVGMQPAPQQLSPSETLHRFHRVVRRFLGVFATAEQPLVVFLDDLQWADLHSLQLIQQMLSQPDMPPILWIGAYRDNEVSPSHPLVSVLEETRKAGARMTELRLEPLSLEQVDQLVADALPGAAQELIAPLSRLVHEKTGGNPFFLLQLLATLHQEGLLVPVTGGGWRWDAEGVQARSYSDNVVEFMVGKLRQLPGEMQHLLRLAAHVGNAFSLQLLGVLAGLSDAEEVERRLEFSLQEGLLVRAGAEQYRFLHDRIQQAAHALLPEAERKALHLRIGRLLLERLSPEQVREELFGVVGQLNAGAELIQEPAERHRVARLNAEAGQKAEAAVAHRAAIAYFKTAFMLIPGDPWETEPTLAFQVQLARARCELLTGNVAEARQLAEQLCSRARTRADTTAAYCLKSDTLMAMGDITASVSCNLECLKLLGLSIPVHPSWEEAEAAHDEAWALLGQRSIEGLIELPPMTDPDMKVLMGAHASLFAKAYVTDNPLLIITLSRMVSLTLRHGFTEASVMGLGWFGVLTGMFFKRYREGLALSMLARGLVERYNLATQRASALLSLELISWFTQPLPESQEIALSGFHHGLQSGDFYSASWCSAAIVVNRQVMGHHLDDVHRETVSRIAFVAKTGIVDPLDYLVVIQAYVQQLRGRSHAFGTLSGEGFDEPSFEAAMTPERMSSTRVSYWLIKLESRFMCGAYEEALDAANKAAGLLWSASGNIRLREFHLYRALTLAALFERATPEQQRQSRVDLQRHHQQLAEWAAQCPETFRVPERMVAAELARLEDRPDEATRAYEEAIRLAREGGASHHLGLASELAANFWRARQAPIVADGFAREARAAYRHWGALGKLQHLDAQWPHLAAAPATKDTSTSSTDSNQVDALTVVKAQQAISSEIVLERLVDTLMQAAIENAGAQRGALVLPNGDTLAVAALSSGTPTELPWTLLSYVQRIREHVLISDASKPHLFSADEYLTRHSARSILCLPLLRQEQFLGALYLENNLATNAFSPARLSLLKYIASQAAISIENARLYADVQCAKAELRRANEELERRVEERTRELEQAQARLVDTAREVGMSEVASNVLHSVGNVLTSTQVNLELMQQSVDGLRVSQLKKAAALLTEHSGSLADFLSQDPRGAHLPEYLTVLADEQMRSQTRLAEDLDVMGRHIAHIRSIIQVQQTYAKATLMSEECELAQIIDGALRIEMAALQRHGVSVKVELSPVPRVKVDRHKVLQILTHLISNAKQAMDRVPEGQRELFVRLGLEGTQARIQVVDTGVGIAPEARARLFVHGFTTRKDGRGFGLHSSALAAQLLGGRLLLESAGLGKGATATLELPLS